MSQCPADRAPEPPPPPPPPSCGAAPPRITENVNKKHVAAPPWIRHIEGGTLVEGIAEGFRHPTPDYPDPIATLLKIRELGWENLLHDFMSQAYPEGEYSPDERERLRDAFRKRFVEGSRDGHAQFRREIAELQATSPDVAKQLEAQLPLNMASDETSGVMMAYYMMAILRMGGVLASRRELQDRGCSSSTAPCAWVNSTGGRASSPSTCSSAGTGSTRNACSESRGRQMPPAAWCAGARSAVARHAPGTALW